MSIVIRSDGDVQTGCGVCSNHLFTKSVKSSLSVSIFINIKVSQHCGVLPVLSSLFDICPTSGGFDQLCNHVRWISWGVCVSTVLEWVKRAVLQ